eukprot:UN16344
MFYNMSEITIQIQLSTQKQFSECLVNIKSLNELFKLLNFSIDNQITFHSPTSTITKRY